MTGSGFGEWYSGSIDVRGDWDNPYLASSPYDREYVHTGWALWVDMNPHVWVEATDNRASENNRDPAAFAVKREGGDLSQPVAVHFSLGGSATGTAQPESAFPDGIAWSNEADYTVEGATCDPDTGGWTVEIPAGQTTADVTVKPLNDPGEDAVETIELSIASDPDGMDGGEYALAATHSATTNPATRPASLAVTLHGLKTTVALPATDPLAGTPSTQDERDDVDAAIVKCGSGDMAEREAGSNDLKAKFRLNPALIPYAQTKAEDEGPEVKARVGRAAQEVIVELDPLTLTAVIGGLGGAIGVSVGFRPPLLPPGAECEKIYLDITTRNIDVLRLRRHLTTSDLRWELPPTATETPTAEFIPRKAGATELRAEQSFRGAVDPESGERPKVAPNRNRNWAVTVVEI